MYVNPFERMRRKREEEKKLHNEEIKEKEKYARLEEQLGIMEEEIRFSSRQNKIPNFEKTENLNHIENRYSGSQSYEFKENFEKPIFEKNEKSKAQDYDRDIFLESPVSGGQQDLQKNYTDSPFFENEENYFNETNDSFRDSFLKENQDNEKFNEYEDFANSELDYETVVLPSVLTTKEYFEAINLNNPGNNIFISVDPIKNFGKEEFETENSILNKNNVKVDINKILMYSSPYLFLLKQFIKGLPPNIALEDKRVLWERTSLLLAATQWGKTQTDIDFILESLMITKDPIEIIAQEFSNLFYDYGLNDNLDLYILNGENIEASKLCEIITFLKEIILKIPHIRIHIHAPIKVLELQSDIENFLVETFIVSDRNLANHFYQIFNKKNVKQTKTPILEPIQKEKFENIVDNIVVQKKHIEIPIEKKTETYKNLEDNFSNLVDTPISNLEKRRNLAAKPYEVRSDKNLEKNVKPESNYSDFDTSSQFDETRNDITKPYDLGFKSNLRINVGSVLQKQKEDLENRRRLDEASRSERTGKVNFNPYVLSRKTSENPHEDLVNYKSNNEEMSFYKASKPRYEADENFNDQNKMNRNWPNKSITNTNQIPSWPNKNSIEKRQILVPKHLRDQNR